MTHGQNHRRLGPLLLAACVGLVACESDSLVQPEAAPAFTCGVPASLEVLTEGGETDRASLQVALNYVAGPLGATLGEGDAVLRLRKTAGRLSDVIVAKTEEAHCSLLDQAAADLVEASGDPSIAIEVDAIRLVLTLVAQAMAE